MLTQSNFKKYLDQFNKLIAEGEAMYKAIKVIPGELYSPAGYGIFREHLDKRLKDMSWMEIMIGKSGRLTTSYF
jgi:hypothetical protein